MLDVMFYEVFKEEEMAIKRFLSSNVKAGYSWKTIQEQDETEPPAEFISIRTQSIIPQSWAKQLKGVLTRSAGYDHLLKYRRENGVNVAGGYLIDYCSRAVAEHAILMTLNLLRKLKREIRQFDDFARDHLTGREARGRNMLVVGVGHIGSETVSLAKGLNMEVKGVDIAPKLKDLEYVSLDNGIKWADVIVSAVPLTEETKKMFDYDALSKAREGTIFINISRGETSPIKDLSRLLEEDKLGGLALDVYPDEARLAQQLRAKSKDLSPEDRELLKLKDRENVIFTPHNAFNTEEAVEQKAKRSAEAIEQFLKNQTFPHPVPQK